MTIFMFYVSAQIPNIEYFELYGGLQAREVSPDMIPTAFEGKFDETKDEIPPGICRPHLLHFFQYWEFEC